MQLTINGKEYELNFGVRFVREMDKNMGAVMHGINFGMGVAKALAGLNAYDAAVLADTIYSATVASKKRPSANEVDDFIDSNTDSANAVKAVAKNMKA